jgi:NRPS condensation-like uncharacterized protein
METRTKRIRWYELDNAAKIYPVITNRHRSSVIRLSAHLKTRVHIGALEKSLERLIPRFPVYQTALRNGFFWYYLEEVSTKPKVEYDQTPYCRQFTSSHQKDCLLFRVRAAERTIAVEFYHVLTDGGGASQFLKALLWEYYSELGHNLPSEGILHAHKPIHPDESKDAYKKTFRQGLPYPAKHEKAFHLPYKIKPASFQLVKAEIATAELLKKARSYKVSVTVYLTATYLFALQKIYRTIKKPNSPIIRIQVPMNLRKVFKIRTIRNFALFVQPEIDMRLGNYTFEELIKLVYHFMQLETDTKQIHRIITRNVHPEKQWMLRVAPRFLKDLVLYSKFFAEGANIQSGVVTNLGRIDLPEALKEEVDHFSFIAPPPNHKFKVNLAMVSYNDKTLLHFGNISHSKQLERTFIERLQDDGLTIKLLTP